MDDERYIESELEFLDRADIGSWVSYAPYSNREQIALQRENLVHTGLYNGVSDITFIFTEDIARMNDMVSDMEERIRIADTRTVIEDEVFYTTKIEGAKTTRARTSELHNGAPVARDNAYSECMVKNSFAAVKLLNLHGNRIDKDILLAVWNTLVDGCCENEEIRGETYRTGDVCAGNYTAPAADTLPELVDGFLEFYNSPKLDNYPFVKAALLHFAFETIHPFPDGNGRLGRLLMNNYLIEQGFDSVRAVSFSMAIDRRRTEYDAAFVRGENPYNDCTPLLQFMMEIMYESFSTALEVQQ